MIATRPLAAVTKQTVKQAAANNIRPLKAHGCSKHHPLWGMRFKHSALSYMPKTELSWHHWRTQHLSATPDFCQLKVPKLT